MIKKFISSILMLSMLCAFAICAHAAEIVGSGECGKNGDNVTWTLDSDGTLTISGTGEMSDYGHVNDENRPWDNNIKKVIINSGVTAIGTCAFYKCELLTEVEIPNTLQSVGERAFEGCNINKVYISDFSSWCNISYGYNTKTPLYKGADIYINNVLATDITIPSDITEINNTMLNGCTSITSVNIPEGVTKIKSDAFRYCSNLKSITIPYSVSYISSGYNYYPSTNTRICWGPFDNCENLETIYYNGAKIELLSISEPEVWTNIANVNIIYGQDTITGNCGDNAEWKIEVIDNKNVLTVNGTGAIYNETVANQYIRNVDKIIINNGITEIGDNAFSHCGAEEVIIADGITRIGNDAFYMSEYLKYVEIPDSVTYIGDYAFKYCPIDSLKIPKGVKELSYQTFGFNGDLEQIYIPKTLEKINQAFIASLGLTDIYYEGSLNEWNNSSVSDTSQFNNELFAKAFTNATLHTNAIGIAPPRIGNLTLGNSLSGGIADLIKVPLTDTEYDSTMITVFYKDGAMVDMQTTLVSANDEEKIVPVTNTDADMAKVMIWSSFDSMKPFCKAETVDLTEAQ